jgi:hypothetical protein
MPVKLGKYGPVLRFPASLLQGDASTGANWQGQHFILAVAGRTFFDYKPDCNDSDSSSEGMKSGTTSRQELPNIHFLIKKQF